MTLDEGARNSVDAYMDRIVREARAAARADALREAYQTCERQTQLASLVAGRSTDFEKGVMSCMAAVRDLAVHENEGSKVMSDWPAPDYWTPREGS